MENVESGGQDRTKWKIETRWKDWCNREWKMLKVEATMDRTKWKIETRWKDWCNREWKMLKVEATMDRTKGR